MGLLADGCQMTLLSGQEARVARPGGVQGT